LNQFLRNVFPRCVIASAVRQPATDILERSIHIGDGALIQLCHGNGSKIPFTLIDPAERSVHVKEG
jgi:hypothetical protein